MPPQIRLEVGGIGVQKTFPCPLPIVYSYNGISYDNLIMSRHIVPTVGSRGNRRRSIVEAILDLRTSIKVVEQKAKGLEE